MQWVQVKQTLISAAQLNLPPFLFCIGASVSTAISNKEAISTINCWSRQLGKAPKEKDDKYAPTMRTAVQITPQAGDVYAWLEQFNVFLQKSLQILGGQLRKWLFNHPRSHCALSLLMAPYWRLRAIKRSSSEWPRCNSWTGLMLPGVWVCVCMCCLCLYLLHTPKNTQDCISVKPDFRNWVG